MLIFYGPKPGTQVKFPLKISRPVEMEIDVPGGGKKKMPIPPLEGIGGDAVIQVTAKVPSEADRREIDALLSRSTVEDDKGKLRIQTTGQAHDAWRFAAIRKLVVNVDDLKIVDAAAPDDPARTQWIHTADELLTFADDVVITALVDVLMDRIRLGEAVAGNFDGRSSSSPAAITAPAATVESAEPRVSALPVPATVPPTIHGST